MKTSHFTTCASLAFLFLSLVASATHAQEQVKIANGVLQGTQDAASGVRSFKGIPFAAPPVGDLRWKEPQSVVDWTGVRKADAFGPRPMQLSLFSDMNFRSPGMSEDCLYLNVWTPAKSAKEKLPVLVYFYGGGYVAGDSSEPRYDGASMAQKGIVAVTVNYRLSVFGFLAHPDLSRESPHQASGNYGLLDQRAALQWVQRNIGAFGGDAKKVTIAGESAGSISVSAQMVSPLSRGLFARAIGESGSILGALPAAPRDQAEASGTRLATALGSDTPLSLAALRAMPAEQLLQAVTKHGFVGYLPTVDGYFFPRDPFVLYANGDQAHVPLLAGVNSEEGSASGVLGQQAATVENYRAALQRLYLSLTDTIFNVYPVTSDAQVLDAAQALASDRFIGHSTWKWIDSTTRNGKQPTYAYLFTHPRPGVRPEVLKPEMSEAQKTSLLTPTRGALHSVEIEYALGNLGGNPVFAWTPDDEKISRTMQSYFANFIKTGDPNGAGLLTWPRFATDQRLVIDVAPRVENVGALHARYKALDAIYLKK